MSASKRPHEEGSRSTPLQRSLEETGVFSVLTGKQTTPLSTDFQVPFEPALDGRMAKLQRTEPHDVDRRSPSLHRKSPSPNNCPDHLNISENRSEIRYSKDGRDVKAASKERSDVRELYSDMRKGPHVSKAGNEVRLDNRGNEGNAAGISDAYWKESKDHDRGKRSFDPIMNLNSNRASLRGSQNTVEIANLITEEWDASEAHDAVGEIRTNRQGEENFTEKDRQKKEEKYGDFGEKNRDAQLGEASNEHKELSREEKETERWEREREDSQKGKEFIDKDKDPLKKGSPSANDKGNRPHEVDMVDGSVRMSEQKVITSEPIRHKDDNWKFERDFKDQKREKDADMGDRYEQRGKCFDKELDDGSIEGDGLAERDREVSGNGIQQRRRMQRTRGNSLTPLREPRFRSRARENEGSQGKPEVSAVVYKVGECIQELVKSWKEFEASEETKIDETRPNYPTLEIRVPAEYVTSCNRQVKCAQLWGTDIYTNDSDLLTVLMHTGYCRQTSSLSASTKELRVTVQVLPPQDEYTSTLRNNIRSRAWRAGASCSFCIQQCCIVKKGGGTIDLEHGLTYISALEPTLTPVSVERTMTTRAAASNALRQQRFVREVSIQYNLCNEPWLKYSISVVADKGLKKPLYTSARLKKGEVLFLETYSNRYELCYNGEKVLCNGTGATSFQNHSSLVQNGDKIVAENTVDVYRWSRCKKILPEETMLSSGIPLRAEDLEIIEDNLEWEDLQWSQTGVLVAGKTYNLARVHFLAPKK